MLDDFIDYPQISGTGPLLLYPDETPFGKIVQHMGVTITPSYLLAHLYAGLPAASALVSKRRFFQAITAACLMMRKKDFLDVGRFDERFINGFEDVDLCARIVAKGGLFTVNPSAVVIHHESQTPGRQAHELQNSQLLLSKSLHLISPDMHVYAKDDGMNLEHDEWLRYKFKLPEDRLARLKSLGESAPVEQLENLLLAWPFWKEGWQKMLNLSAESRGELPIAKIFLKLYTDPDVALSVWDVARRQGDEGLANFAERVFCSYAIPPQQYLTYATSCLKSYEKLNFTDLSTQLRTWITNYSDFKNRPYNDYLKLFRVYAQKKGLPPESNIPEPGPSLSGGSLNCEEYVKLYPEVADLGYDPYLHYVLGGMQEGRKGHFSRIDYSGLTPERIETWRNAKDSSVVVCTSVCGDHDRLLPPAFLNDGWRYICFTDRPREDWGIWKLREIPYKNKDLIRKSRWAKLHLPQLFPQARRIIWQDANIVIADDLSPYIDKGKLAMVAHPNSRCIYQEVEEGDISGNCTQAKIASQVANYRAHGLPENFGMWETNFFTVDPSASKVKEIFAQWWQEYEKYCSSDQISLPYVFYKNRFKPAQLLPDSKNARNWPCVHFLTHEETKWITPPDPQNLRNIPV